MEGGGGGEGGVGGRGGMCPVCPALHPDPGNRLFTQHCYRNGEFHEHRNHNLA